MHLNLAARAEAAVVHAIGTALLLGCFLAYIFEVPVAASEGLELARTPSESVQGLKRGLLGPNVNQNSLSRNQESS